MNKKRVYGMDYQQLKKELDLFGFTLKTIGDSYVVETEYIRFPFKRLEDVQAWFDNYLSGVKLKNPGNYDSV